MSIINLENTKEEVINKRTKFEKRYGSYCIGFGDIYYRFNENNKVILIERKCKHCNNFTKINNSAYLYNYCANCRSKDTNKRTQEIYKIVKLNKDNVNNRICLCCGKNFLSKNNGNRICSVCYDKVEFNKINDLTYKVGLIKYG
mgnify:FL=1